MKELLSSFWFSLESAIGQLSYNKAVVHNTKKVIFWSAVVILGIWYFGGKRLLYQSLYGHRNNTPIEIADSDRIYDIPSQPVQRARINGFDVDIELVKRFETTTRIVYVDRYSALGSWYRANDGASIYDKVVPQDLSFSTGEMGRHPECLEFSHEYRVLFPVLKCRNLPYRNEEVSNNHTIAANKNVQKGLDILKAGDIAHIEGYLVYWRGVGRYSYYDFKSAIQLGQASTQLVGGMKGGLCRQLYLTKLTFDGYTFE